MRLLAKILAADQSSARYIHGQIWNGSWARMGFINWFAGYMWSGSFLGCQGTATGFQWTAKGASGKGPRQKNAKSVANPFSPYSLQKRPKPKTCPKFVQAIVLGGSSQGGWNLEKFVKICPKITVFQNLTNFSKFQSPWLEPPKTIAGTNFGQIWGFGRFWRL